MTSAALTATSAQGPASSTPPGASPRPEDKRYGGPGYAESEIAIARRLDRLARAWGLGMQQVSLAWLLSRPAVASVIIGAETVEELRANASAADVELTQEQLDAVSALTSESRS